MDGMPWASLEPYLAKLVTLKIHSHSSRLLKKTAGSS